MRYSIFYESLDIFDSRDLFWVISKTSILVRREFCLHDYEKKNVYLRLSKNFRNLNDLADFRISRSEVLSVIKFDQRNVQILLSVKSQFWKFINLKRAFDSSRMSRNIINGFMECFESVCTCRYRLLVN